VAWHDHPDHPPAFWSVTNHRFGLEVLTDWRTYSSAGGTSLRPDLGARYPGAGTMLVLTDPPRHDVLRKAVAGLFTPRAVAAHEARTREVIRTLWARATQAGGCDFATDVAAHIPLAVTAELLAVAPEDAAILAEATEAAGECSSLDLASAEAQMAHYQVLEYYADALEQRRHRPGNDLVSAFVRARQAGMDISDDEIILACDNVVVAAAETTRQAATTGLHALLEHPDQWAALRSGRIDHRLAVEELLRWTCPIAHLLRTAVTDTTLGGAPVQAGDAVVVWLPSMNRDEAVFPDGDRLVLDRPVGHHTSFGHGVHFCLGAALSRLVLRVMLQELGRDRATVAPAGPPRRLASYIVNGLASLPLTITPAG
jgi:cytochrome P450